MTDKDQINTGGAAFPSMYDQTFEQNFGHEAGMTLRDYFAAHADGFSDQVTVEFAAEATGMTVPDSHNGYDVALFWSRADAAYKYMQADAMLSARGEVK